MKFHLGPHASGKFFLRVSVKGLDTLPVLNARVKETIFNFDNVFQKYPSRAVLIKRCSDNMLQICRRTPMPKCDFKKVFFRLVGLKIKDILC